MVLRILFIIPSYKPAFIYGGPILSVSTLAEALASSGNQVTVYTTTANGTMELNVVHGHSYSIEGVSVHYFRRLTKGHTNFCPSLLKALYTTANKFDVIHIHSWWNLVTIPAVWICLRKGVTPLISPRGTLTRYSFTHSRSIARKIFHSISGRNLLSRAALVFTSEREKEEALLYVSGKSTHVLGNVLDLPVASEYFHLDKPYLKILFLGRIDPAKNLEFLFKVLAGMEDFPFQLSIAGEGNDLYVQQLKQLALEVRQMKWIGGVEGEDKYRRLADADLLVLPSHTENFGNVVFEALSQGTPVLVSDQVGAKDYILENKLGWVVPLDEDKWKSTLAMIWHSSKIREDIRARAPLCIKRDFDRKKQIVDYIELYKSHMKERGKV